MNIVISADDFALTDATSKNILEAVNYGCVNLVSVVPNGYSFDSSIELLGDQIYEIEFAVHLNLCEGLPVATSSKCGALLNDQGRLHFSFQGLWMEWLKSSDKKRHILKSQIKAEINEQIAKFCDSLPFVRNININSHQHFHLMPPVFDALMELNEKYSFRSIRIVREPMFISTNRLNSIRNIFSDNFAKHALLNCLSRNHAKRLGTEGIAFPDIFIGVLYTGFMCEKTILSALARLRRNGAHYGLVELLLHPGRAAGHEREFWSERPELGNYYCSEWRDVEKQSSKAQSVRALLAELRLVR